MQKKLASLIGILVFSVLWGRAGVACSQEYTDFASYLMRSTFKIQANGVIGTGFVVGVPVPNTVTKFKYAFVTATHVLDSIKTESATLFLRRKEGQKFFKVKYRLSIRRQGLPLWTAHPVADVAVIPIHLPLHTDLRAVPIELLATDAYLQKYEIHPGDEVFVLGFPYGVEAGPAGFPILRSGRIASFPLTPVKETRTFLIDFEVFRGNSGGPVFLASANRVYDGSVHMGMTHMILGIVSMEKKITETVNIADQAITQTHRLSIAVVVHAQFLKELIEKVVRY